MTRRHHRRATRRRVLQAGLAAVGGAIAASARAQDATQKVPQSGVQYQATPKDGQQCSTCVNFVPPNACKLVAGSIAPTGWCLLYAPKG